MQERRQKLTYVIYVKKNIKKYSQDGTTKVQVCSVITFYYNKHNLIKVTNTVFLEKFNTVGIINCFMICVMIYKKPCCTVITYETRNVFP